MYKTIGKTLIKYINIHNYSYYNRLGIYNLHAYAHNVTNQKINVRRYLIFKKINLTWMKYH